MARTYKKEPTHHFGNRKQEGQHAAPEYTANGAAISDFGREWPTTDKFLADMRAHAKPRFADVTRDESRAVILRLVKP